MLAKHAGIDADDDLVALALERSSLAYMLENKDKFDDAIMRAVSERKCNLPLGSDSAKVREGKVGSHKAELPKALSDRMDEAWAKLVEPETGFAAYADLDRAVRERNG
ncbi:MAG: hypothetical protein V2J26_06435 [Pacificimonas sp.]|jgi:hypothetical protein|nr:hypothetical protein [Pacificimonas sp.]